MNNLHLLSLILAPHVSEKATLKTESDRQYVFRVVRGADKAQVKKAIELAFSVKVEKVNLLNVKGKEKRFGRFMGKRSDWKKAYVKLQPGFSIELATA